MRISVSSAGGLITSTDTGTHRLIPALLFVLPFLLWEGWWRTRTKTAYLDIVQSLTSRLDLIVFYDAVMNTPEV